MKKYSNFLIVFLSSIFLLFIFLKREIVSKTIITSLGLWLNTLVPSMFPMFVLSDILISYNFIEYIPRKIMHFFQKLFNISEGGILVIFLSLISGFPSNARNIAKALDEKLISKEEADHLLFFNHFANPLFVIQTVGFFFLGNTTYGIIIFISHLLSNFMIGVLFRRKSPSTTNNHIIFKKESQSFGTILSSSIKKSIDSLLMVAGVATLFLILGMLITNIFTLSNRTSFFLQSILEMTMGLSSLAHLNFHILPKIILSTMIISFGGLSVHLQVLSFLDESNLKYHNYLIGRIYQALISGFIAFIITSLLY